MIPHGPWNKDFMSQLLLSLDISVLLISCHWNMWRILIGILDPQLVVVFGEITESLGGVALLEKVQHSEQACRIHSLTQLLLSRVLPVWGWKMCSVYFLLQSGWHAFQPGCTLSLWNHKLSWKSFFSQVIFGQKYFTTATGKHLI